jgi:hypothetical protein
MNRTLVLAAIAALLMVPASIVRATPELPDAQKSDDEEELARFQAAIAEMRAVMLQPGERVEGWDVGGADPDAELRALGAETHYFLNRSESGVGVTILTDRPISAFAPQAWRIVDTYGAASERLVNPQLDFMPFSDRYVMAARAHTWNHNDAGCFRNLSHAVLYEVPGAPERDDDEIVPLMFRMTILAMEGQTICVRSDGNRESGWRSRFFLPDGRALPALTSATDLLTIVPAAPVETLIVAAPERSPTF